MALRVKCKCGKVLQVSSKLADKRVRCTGCGVGFVLPRARFEASAKAPGAPAKNVPAIRTAPPKASGSANTPLMASPEIKPNEELDTAPANLDLEIADLSGSISLLSDGEDLSLSPAVDIPPPRPVMPEPSSQGPPVTCPSCGKQLPANSKICVQCGVDIKTGRSLITTDDANLDEAYIRAENSLRWISWLMFTGFTPIASEAFGTKTPYVIRSTAIITVLVSAWFLIATIGSASGGMQWRHLMLWCGKGEPAAMQNFDDFVAEVSEDEDMDLSDADTMSELREEYDSMVEQEQNWANGAEYHTYQLLTHALLHGGLLHLVGNMIFLLVFGSRVNALVGNVYTAVLYPILAIAGGIAHRIASVDLPLHPMIGASGAIMGLAGMYFVLFPIHKVHMVAWWRWGFIGRFKLSMKIFAVRGFWVVLFYIGFDVFYTAMGIEDGVAHWAHLGGFIAGAVIAIILVVARLVNARGADIFSAILGKHAWKIVGKPR